MVAGLRARAHARHRPPPTLRDLASCWGARCLPSIASESNQVQRCLIKLQAASLSEMDAIISALGSAHCPSFLTCKSTPEDSGLFEQLCETLAGADGAAPVRGLRLESCSLGDLQAEQLLSSLIIAPHGHISVLELPDNSIGVVGASKIAELLEEAGSLTTIDLQGV